MEDLSTYQKRKNSEIEQIKRVNEAAVYHTLQKRELTRRGVLSPLELSESGKSDYIEYLRSIGNLNERLLETWEDFEDWQFHVSQHYPIPQVGGSTPSAKALNILNTIASHVK